MARRESVMIYETFHGKRTVLFAPECWFDRTRIPVIGGPVTQLYQVARYYCVHGQVIKIDKPVPDVLRE